MTEIKITIEDRLTGEYDDEYIELSLCAEEVTLRDGKNFITLTHSQIDDLYHKKQAFVAAKQGYESGEN